MRAACRHRRRSPGRHSASSAAAVGGTPVNGSWGTACCPAPWRRRRDPHGTPACWAPLLLHAPPLRPGRPIALQLHAACCCFCGLLDFQGRSSTFPPCGCAAAASAPPPNSAFSGCERPGKPVLTRRAPQRSGPVKFILLCPPSSRRLQEVCSNRSRSAQDPVPGLVVILRSSGKKKKGGRRLSLHTQPTAGSCLRRKQFPRQSPHTAQPRPQRKPANPPRSFRTRRSSPRNSRSTRSRSGSLLSSRALPTPLAPPSPPSSSPRSPRTSRSRSPHPQARRPSSPPPQRASPSSSPLSPAPPPALAQPPPPPRNPPPPWPPPWRPPQPWRRAPRAWTWLAPPPPPAPAPSAEKGRRAAAASGAVET